MMQELQRRTGGVYFSFGCKIGLFRYSGEMRPYRYEFERRNFKYENASTSDRKVCKVLCNCRY
jgi:hypothetical protein